LSPSAAATSGPVRAPVQKQRLNIYTMMLILSFFAITAACILLWMELWQYNSDPKSWLERWWDTSRAKPVLSLVQPAAAPLFERAVS
jgi:hypothetical protein